MTETRLVALLAAALVAALLIGTGTGPYALSPARILQVLAARSDDAQALVVVHGLHNAARARRREQAFHQLPSPLVAILAMQRAFRVQLQDDLFAFIEQAVGQAQEGQDVASPVLGGDDLGIDPVLGQELFHSGSPVVGGGDEHAEVDAAAAYLLQHLFE